MAKDKDKKKELYDMERALELGYKPDETGHYPSVDHETGIWLKDRSHPTAHLEYREWSLNPELNKQYDLIIRPDGKLQYVEKKQYGGSHGYEELFSNYMNMLTSSFNQTQQQEQTQEEPKKDEYLEGLYNQVELENLTGLTAEETGDFNLDQFTQNLDNQLQELEMKLFDLSYGKATGNYSGFTGAAPSEDYNGKTYESVKSGEGKPGLNNVGNLRDVKTGLFRSFNTYEEGRKALEYQLYLYQSGKTSVGLTPNSTLLQAMSKYAPSADNNNPKSYANFIAKRLGVSINTPIKDLDLVKWADAVERLEDNPARRVNQYGGEELPQTHGYEELFNRYFTSLEQMFSNTNQNISLGEQEEIEEEDEYLKSLTNYENEEKMLTFANQFKEIEERYSSKIQQMSDMISMMSMYSQEDLYQSMRSSTDFNYSESLETAQNKGNQPVQSFPLPKKGVNSNISSLFEEYSKKYGVGNLGIFPSKEHLKRSPNSDHNTGDAIDLGTGKPRDDIASQLVKEAKQRNIKYVIHNGKIWSQKRASEGWRKYTGSNKHATHIHVSFNR